MSEDLLMIATFQSPVEANLAKNRLEAAGIPAFLEGEEAAAMAWPFANAAGGVKLHVAARDAPQASACLAGADSVTGVASGESTPAAETTGITLERGRAAKGITLEPKERTGEEEEPSLTAREQNASRAWRGAVLGLLFLPLQMYVFYLVLKVYVSDDELSEEHRRRAWMAAAINLPLVLILGLFLRAWLLD
jgi:hypothetical protein